MTYWACTQSEIMPEPNVQHAFDLAERTKHDRSSSGGTPAPGPTGPAIECVAFCDKPLRGSW